MSSAIINGTLILAKNAELYGNLLANTNAVVEMRANVFVASTTRFKASEKYVGFAF